MKITNNFSLYNGRKPRLITSRMINSNINDNYYIRNRHPWIHLDAWKKSEAPMMQDNDCYYVRAHSIRVKAVSRYNLVDDVVPHIVQFFQWVFLGGAEATQAPGQDAQNNMVNVSVYQATDKNTWVFRGNRVSYSSNVTPGDGLDNMMDFDYTDLEEEGYNVGTLWKIKINIPNGDRKHYVRHHIIASQKSKKPNHMQGRKLYTGMMGIWKGSDYNRPIDFFRNFWNISGLVTHEKVAQCTPAKVFAANIYHNYNYSDQII
jgi:hypothetical protein